MRIAKPLAATLTALLLVVLAPKANAQPLFDDLPTLEWRTAQADLVITARILDFEVEFGDYGVSRLGLTLGTIETIKGDADPLVEVSIDTPGVLDSVAEGLATRRDAGMIDAWFLTKEPDTGTSGAIGHDLHMSMLPLTDWPTVDKPGSWLRRPLAPAVTMDFVRHDGKAAVMGAIRTVVREEPPRAAPGTPPPSHGLHIALMFHDRLWPENANPFFLTVPADARLEALARRLVEQPESFFDPLPETATQRDRRARPSRESALRQEGAKALAGHFQNEENARLLATLLDDTSTGRYRPSGLGEPTRHWFTTRKIAFDALTTWGVEVPGVELEAPINDASLAPSPAAVGAAHGPRGDWYDVSEFFIELNGDSNPELLRLYLIRDKYGDTDYDLERFRTQGAMCWAFSLFAFHEGEPAMVFHRGNSLEGFALSLREHDGRPMLLTKQPHEWTTRSAFGWWPMWGSIEHAHWSARTGDWDGEAHTFSPTGEAPLVRFDHSK